MPIEVEDFQREVVEASHQLPVLADFWAEWCGPCRVLGPTLERLAEGNEGRWLLAKVDTEAHPEVAAAFGIRSIPDVRLFVDGEPVDGFVGALPEPAIRRWLEGALPDPEGQALAAKVEGALQLAEGGQVEESIRILEELLADAPTEPRVRYALARVRFPMEPEEALGLLERWESDVVPEEKVEAVRTLAELLRDFGGGAGDPADPGAAALLRLREADLEGAVEAFIQMVREAEPESAERDRARRAVVALFHLFGMRDPRVTRYREALSRALYT